MLIKESIRIARNPEVIWNYWMDVSNDVHWRKGIINADWTSKPPYEKGSTGQHTHKDMGVMKWEVTGFEKGSSFKFIHTEGGLKGSIAIFQLKPEGNGSLVIVQMSVRGSFIMRFMIFFMAGRMRNGVRGDLQKLKEILEQRDGVL